MKLEIVEKQHYIAASDTQVGCIYKIKDEPNNYLRVIPTGNQYTNTVPFVCLGTNTMVNCMLFHFPVVQHMLYVGEAKISLV